MKSLLLLTVYSDILRGDKGLNEHTEKTGHENVNIDHIEILSNDDKDNRSKENLWMRYILSMKDCSERSRTISAIKVIQLARSRGVVGIDKHQKWSFFVKSVNHFSC